MPGRNVHMTLEKWFFLVLSLFVLSLFWTIMEPFAFVLITALITAIVISPLERSLNRFLGHKHISAAIMTVGVLMLVFVPLILLVTVMIGQAKDILAQPFADQGWIEGTRTVLHSLLFFLPEQIQTYFINYDLGALQSKAAQWTFNNLGSVFASTTEGILNTFLYFLSLYYLLVDRDLLVNKLVSLSPLRDSLDLDLIRRLIVTVRSVVFGVLLIGILQGILAAIGMTIFGVPGALIWGAITIIASLVPFVGTALVLIPAILYLFFTGSQTAALGLLIWSVVCVGLADNFVGPFLMKGTTNMNALLILLSILGGLQTFGPIGIIVGPTILAGFLALIELYTSGVFHKDHIRELKKPNKKDKQIPPWVGMTQGKENKKEQSS